MCGSGRWHAAAYGNDERCSSGGMYVSELIEARELSERLNGMAAPMVIDVRGPKEYAAGHVAGAVNIPLSQLPKKLKRISREGLVVTYCNMHHRGESRGERAATLLRENGYDARALDGGYPIWKEAGLPVAQAAPVAPVSRV
jgi:rhodanese-related sulfurtransferase